MKSKIYKSLIWGTAMALMGNVAFAGPEGVNEAPVVIVCEHGSAKSMIAAHLFNKAAQAKGLSLHAVSRGTDPDDAVPPVIIDAMAAEGFDVRQFKPRKLSAEDVQGAAKVVSIGEQLHGVALLQAAGIRRWDDVPSAGQEFQASKASLQAYVNALVDELAAKR